ncbi:class I SAM-dependent methyltransferase [Skermania sp. ID1734]|uniref:class I SAM-dependent methyltransferase n=1 Tax=Skermania sp. ID1734 TaxID=2597516 RepID=UPI00117DF62C|nr:class I SAM-dependent methyltransferase [Skermania sp. ID1734]TSD93530.1 class I SAM-dependent methyltransferase [Skermania sp. ID1734]
MPIIPSPDIWYWPDVYERENAAQDVDGVIFATLREVADWTGRDVVDIGCGTGFHLPIFARDARSVLGVEPHAKLRKIAADRVAGTGIGVLAGSAEALPLPDSSVDVLHARTAYFFGAESAPGLAEANRVLRPGGVLVIVDLDTTAHDYGSWMRADLPHYNAVAVERFFADNGFDLRRVDTRWEFPDRPTLAWVLAIEFTAATAARALVSTPGLALTVRYRIHTRVKPRGLALR